MSFDLPDFSAARVLVVGDVMLDRYWQGETNRISPEAPVPVLKVDEARNLPGGAANVAVNIAALGANVRLMGLVGEDEAGEQLLQECAAAKVDTVLLPCAQPTITKLRILSRHQQLLRLDFEQPFAASASAALITAACEQLAEADVLVLSDYAKGSLHDPQPLIAAARKLGVPVLVDPKGKDFTRYAGAQLLTPNLAEMRAVLGACSSEAELLQQAQALLQSLALPALLITRGEAGMTLLQTDAEPLHLSACTREVFDVTGAGDTVIALLAASLAVGCALPQATHMANLAAGLVVSKLGTAKVNTAELQAHMRGPEPRGVVSQAALPEILAQARAAGERIVFTNGCFDLLHAGHVSYLAAARALGDRLLVAVNSDTSVRKLKGAGRPVIPLAQRMSVLAALAAVDWVIAFDEDTPEALLHSVRPEILVKGGDYTREQVVGREWVESYGGEVKVLAAVDGCSTSSILTRISGD